MAFSGDSDSAHGRPEARNLLIFWSHTEDLMRHSMPTLANLAAALALALALLVGVLLPSDNAVHAADPEFVDAADPITREVPENTPPGVNIGAPISATDDDETGDTDAGVAAIEFGDTLTYSLSGADADKFDIDASTGQLITKAPLDFENPRGGTAGDSNTYLVTVTAKDSMGGSVARDVTITVTDVEERPGAVAPPTVVSTDSDTDATTYELKVIWYPPDATVEDIASYSVQYKKTTETSFGTEGVAIGTFPATTATITGLDVDTSYQVRVRATNSVGDGPWSLSSVGSTNKKDNALPVFGLATVTRNVLENSDPGLDVGFRVSATDDDHVLPLAYGLHGPDANSFDLQASTGQIRTKRGVVYDFETKPRLNVTVTVSDRQGGTDATAVTINVTNVPEAPSKPARPKVLPTQGSSRSLNVSWTAPDNTGPAITGYNLRYREGNSGRFRLISPTGTGTTYTLMPENLPATPDVDERLTPGKSYEVYVRAQNGESPSEWSAAGTGRTSAGNSEPRFDDRMSLSETAPTTDRTVAENTRAGQSVGRAVRAVDGNGDTRTYRLIAETVGDTASEAAVAKFDINPSTGQILTKDPLNHEAECSADDAPAHVDNCTYTVMVQVWDGLDEDRNEQDTAAILGDDDPANDATVIDDAITVTITVSDVVEKPAAPTVTVTSPFVADDAESATLTVTWDMPKNTGPAITGYVVECTGDGITTDTPCPQPTSTDISDLTLATQAYTMTLTPKDLTRTNSYRVRVRADNAEGQGAWSSWVTQSTSKAGNTLPTFTSPTDGAYVAPTVLYVVENASSARQPLTSDEAGFTVASIQREDATDGDSPLTLRLQGPDAGRFDIVASTGEIRTKSKLNHEDPECYDDSVATTTCIYSVRVKLSDPNGGSILHALTIRVRDQVEPPAKPSAPRVTATSGSGWSLEVTWNAPRNTGPAITGYEIRYRKTGDSTAPWQEWDHTGTGRSAKITTILSDPADDTSAVHLEPRTQYEVQVRALNGEGDSTFADATNWSTSGRGTTGASNERPVFDDALPAVVMLEVEENTRAGQSVGSAIEATDPDKNRLTYTLEGPGKDSFTITSTGQIRTRAALNHEEREFYSLTVKVNDGQRRNNSVAAKPVTITVLDLPEPPSTPRAPRVAGIPGSTDSVRVTWDEPANMGPPITHYNLRYAVSGSRDAFTLVDPPDGNADRSAVITGLAAGTRYAVQVRAWNDDNRHSDWSPSGTGSPNPDVANTKPTFTPRSHTFSVAENTPPGTDVGSLVAALDPDGDTLTYSLEGVDADSFDIIATSSAGQIQTKAALNFEEKSRYSVAVRARDGRGGTDAVNVTINVTDVDNEAPDTPFAPTVTALSSTSIQVSWDAPENTGPPITDYDYRYRARADSDWTEVTNTTITATTATIDGLAASTSYDVEVRAKNAEGTSDWSNPGNGATNDPGANNPPVFTEGASATRAVSATSPSGTNIGDPVAATDADSDDTVTYSLEGRDAPSFDINETTGQLRTKSGITLIVGTTYTVTVVADDTKDTTRIEVSIEATAAPPNIVPVFTEGARATRSVNASAAAGTNVGTPVSATDADTGDTITYSLEGTDAASFSIVAASGQIQTRSGITLTQTTYTVTVRATDSKGGSATITVTINVNLNTPPVFSEGASTTRSVVEPVARFTNIGSPVAATDADGDTLTYSLEGTDRDSFLINSTGQLITMIELTVATKASYSIIVVARDGKEGGEARITVTINVNAPPNAAPVFNEGSSATRSVREDASAGSSIGAPVTATDADNDTLTYSLEGTDAASFAIDATSGQLLTRSGVTLTANQAYTVTVVANDGRDSARITVTINVTVRRTYGCATSVAVSDESNTGLASDCEALLRARSILEGSVGRDDQLDWDLRDPIADWEGVFLGGSPQRVTAIVLRRRGLNGSVPADLGDLTMLTQLNLHSNNLRGNIPDEIGNLTNLQRLFLHNNSLSGDFPNLSRLRNLERLWLSGTNQRVGMGDGIPAWLNGLTNLQELNLWGNEIGGAIPNLSGLSNLKLLKLQNNSLTGTIPSWFGDMSGLSGLYLHANDLTGTIPANLGRNTGIVRLWLDRNDLSGSIPSELGNMSSLRTLNLRGNMLSGNIPPELGDLSRLQVLRLQDNRRVDDGGTVVSGGLTGAIPSELGDLGELLTLAASNNSLTGAIPPELGNLGKLRVLWLHNNGLTGAIPSALGDLGDTLTNIKLAGNSFATNACVPRALANVGSNDYSAAGLSICP